MAHDRRSGKSEHGRTQNRQQFYLFLTEYKIADNEFKYSAAQEFLGGSVGYKNYTADTILFCSEQ
jgi:hypothetical protein